MSHYSLDVYMWTVNLALGYLNVQQRYRINCLDDPIPASDYRELSPLL